MLQQCSKATQTRSNLDKQTALSSNLILSANSRVLSIKIILPSRDKKMLCVVPTSNSFLEHSGITVAEYPEYGHKYRRNGMTRVTPNFSPECHTPTGAASPPPSPQSPAPPSRAIKRPLRQKQRSSFSFPFSANVFK